MKDIGLPAAISIVALSFSIISFALSYSLSRSSAIISTRPVLVFEYDREIGWMIKNVGSGPALNVLVAQKEVGRAWFNPVRVPPVASGGAFVPNWLGHTNTTGLGVTYFDVRNVAYTSTTGNDLTEISVGSSLGNWKETEIGRHWNQPPYND